MIIPVILSGGSGTRLWPLSRKHYPKQLLDLTGSGNTLLQDTITRVATLHSPIIVCNETHRFMVAEQCHAIDVIPQAILLEPLARNTAPAIALAAIAAQQQHPEAIIAVFPADHIIADQSAFDAALTAAIAAAEQDQLVTFGIVADRAETGYGYIKANTTATPQATGVNGPAPLRVEQFVEKPDAETAQRYIDSGDYFWNSGMFVFKASVYLDALQAVNKDIVTCCTRAYQQAQTDLDFTRIDQTAFAACPDDSIDYALMEKADKADNMVVVVPMQAGWNDIGSWSSLWDIAAKDRHNNAHLGDVIAIDSHNNLVHNRDKLVATIGMENTVIIDTKDALLVAHKDQVQKVKQVVAQLQQQQREECLLHREVHRPWGSYDPLGSGPRYQVKTISVKPGASLSSQMHHHRAEHWIVVSGTAAVEVDGKTTLLSENQSAYIPLGAQHRLSNPGKIALELIEVQSGSYLGEDDIVRFDDDFGRC